MLKYAVATALVLTLAGHASAVPADLAALGASQPASDVQLARWVAHGPNGGWATGGGGRYVHGGRYYGGVWYGTGRRYWNGRWWPYGVGSCWSPSPIGYVWVC